ncbi:MAG: 2-amino-4-hydroxy-6-hydroxymethyldihydropteridine diphosphokinase [Spirulinaceae cyanobacterium RM2_2_10]|nr:2-amino-4-hydroxy-6-hydroxymethyldihydropteridine diphosphokinase [Spirulinaceae cyanobacterium SM2_1_0]NJO19906.1 2-amino-4-hydroxy-6-hydroxymethyldihydropteridine diphosphokinase [Spirulinaceae cyanobacterium RM2_2_10]
MPNPQSLTPTLCAIALGSNLGEPLAHVQGAVQCLDQTPTLALQACSRWYSTTAVGPPQPDYINGCVLVHSQLAPLALLDHLLAIERQFGRIRRERNGPRTLDLDLLLYGDQIIDLPRLQVPHPRMCDRPFVLVPLAEIAPDWHVPNTQHTVRQLLQTLDSAGVHRLTPEVCP